MDEFVEYDLMHDKISTGINITQSGLVDIIINSIKEPDNILYELLYFCIMPNHVHLMFYTGNIDNPKPLGLIMKAIKGSSSRKINLFLNKTGTFWQKASYDRLVRDEKELNYIADYILNNP
ncbi:MAG: transposase, partial [Saprospiraceae bacterium]